MTAAADLTIWLALGAGVLSFLSPCTLPIFPAYLSYIPGMSVKELKDNKDIKIRSKLLIHSVFPVGSIKCIYWTWDRCFVFRSVDSRDADRRFRFIYSANCRYFHHCDGPIRSRLA